MIHIRGFSNFVVTQRSVPVENLLRIKGESLGAVFFESIETASVFHPSKNGDMLKRDFYFYTGPAWPAKKGQSKAFNGEKRQ